MAEKTRLDLGCDDNYILGYVNIDKYNSFAVDNIYDIEDLPL